MIFAVIGIVIGIVMCLASGFVNFLILAAAASLSNGQSSGRDKLVVAMLIAFEAAMVIGVGVGAWGLAVI
jgi:hypothetical protein